MIKDILKPKPVEEIIEDLNNPDFLGCWNPINKILSLFFEYEKNKQIICFILASDCYKSIRLYDNAMIACCKYDYVEVAQIIIDKNILNIHAFDDRYYRLAEHHSSIKMMNLLNID